MNFIFYSQHFQKHIRTDGKFYHGCNATCFTPPRSVSQSSNKSRRGIGTYRKRVQRSSSATFGEYACRVACGVCLGDVVCRLRCVMCTCSVCRCRLPRHLATQRAAAKRPLVVSRQDTLLFLSAVVCNGRWSGGASQQSSLACDTLSGQLGACNVLQFHTRYSFSVCHSKIANRRSRHAG